MKRNRYKSPVGNILTAILVGVFIAGFGGLAADVRAEEIKEEEAAVTAAATPYEAAEKTAKASKNTDKEKSVRRQKSDAGGTRMLLTGGMNFGVRLATDGVLVVGFGENGTDGRASAAYRAGIRLSDAILSVNGKKMLTANDVSAAVDASEGKPLTLLCRRKGETLSFTVTPEEAENGKYKIGTWLRDSSAGIGTVTFIDPTTLSFGGLGHGICDTATGEIIPVSRGSVTDAVITGIERGSAGAPGEMKGYLGKHKRGTLLTNTECGLFGILSDLPKGAMLLPVGRPSDVTCGEATLLSTLDGEEVTPYKIQITAIGDKDSKTKSFSIKVEDEALLSKTGGIIQGMSGSPIIQNGKLIGAVTHVLIADPTGGYGIFIENMLDAMPSILQP